MGCFLGKDIRRYGVGVGGFVIFRSFFCIVWIVYRVRYFLKISFDLIKVVEKFVCLFRVC